MGAFPSMRLSNDIYEYVIGEEMGEKATLITEAFAEACKECLETSSESNIHTFVDTFRSKVYLFTETPDPWKIEIERLQKIEEQYHQLIRDMDRYQPGATGYQETKKEFEGRKDYKF
jgi:hypothetical protein